MPALRNTVLTLTILVCACGEDAVELGPITAGCGPCVAAIPDLQDSYDRFHEAGFTIINIARDGEDKVRAFVSEHGIEWPQVVEEEDPMPLHLLYRVDRWPSYYLVGSDGLILSHNPRGDKLNNELENHLPSG